VREEARDFPESPLNSGEVSARGQSVLLSVFLVSMILARISEGPRFRSRPVSARAAIITGNPAGPPVADGAVHLSAPLIDSK